MQRKHKNLTPAHATRTNARAHAPRRFRRRVKSSPHAALSSTLYLPYPGLYRHPDIGLYLSYGIAVLSLHPFRVLSRVPDVSPSFRAVLSLSRRCAKAQLYPGHLKDVVEDFLNV